MIKDAEFSNFTEHKNQKKFVLIWFFFVKSECEQNSAHIVSPELVLTSAIVWTKYTMLIDRLTTERRRAQFVCANFLLTAPLNPKTH